MKIVQYNNGNDIVVEFQDEYKYKIHTTYQAFYKGNVKNPYYPSVYGVGVVGDKYPISKNGKLIKEYDTWKCMLRRCFDKRYKEKQPSYQNVSCCDEWLLYENFYEWIHEQENFDKWLVGVRWALDKDILIKGNKTYSPNACCLVPQNVNNVFTIKDIKQDISPVTINEVLDYCDDNQLDINRDNIKYAVECISKDRYKFKKENLIRKVAQKEYIKGNITKQCYDAMINCQAKIVD